MRALHADLLETAPRADDPAPTRLHAKIMGAVREHSGTDSTAWTVQMLRPGTIGMAAAIVLLIAVAGWRLAPWGNRSGRVPAVAEADRLSPPQVAVLLVPAEKAATAPPRILAEAMQQEVRNLTNDISRAAAFLLSRLR
jgi:hypothetical protein